jgi:ribosome-associated heat shock protein Hsp15
VRLNRNRVSKNGQNLKAGDVLTLTLYSGVKVIKVLGEAERRGPASAAQALYEDLTGMHMPHATPEIPGAIAK